MRNRAAGRNARAIPYNKIYRVIGKSVTGTILLQQLEFHFARNGWAEGFYKFLEVPAAKKGQGNGVGWLEELGFSVEEFRSAFDQIGVRHKSKSLYNDAENPFLAQRPVSIRNVHRQAVKSTTEFEDVEMYYCSYHDRATGRTHYFRNDDLIDEALTRAESDPPVNQQSLVTGNQQCPVAETNKASLHLYQEEVTKEKEETGSFSEEQKQPEPEDAQVQVEAAASLPLHRGQVESLTKPEKKKKTPKQMNRGNGFDRTYYPKAAQPKEQLDDAVSIPATDQVEFAMADVCDISTADLTRGKRDQIYKVAITLRRQLEAQGKDTIAKKVKVIYDFRDWRREKPGQEECKIGVLSFIDMWKQYVIARRTRQGAAPYFNAAV